MVVNERPKVQDEDDYQITAEDTSSNAIVNLENRNLKDKHIFEINEIVASWVDISGALGPRALALTNLPRNMNEEEVRRFLKRYGEIEHVHMFQNIKGWTSHAIVEFFKERSAQRCAH